MLTAEASAADAALRQKMFGSGMATLIISNEETNDVIPWRIWFIKKGVSETIQNEAKEQKGGFLSML